MMTFEELKKKARLQFGIDMESYKDKQLRRRVDTFMQRHKIADYDRFFFLLKTQRNLYEAFLNHFTINVSEFFRDPRKFEELEKVHLPALLTGKNRLKIWSAACSIGAEPFSVAIILDEITPGIKHRILATDVDRNVLYQATRGRYKPDTLKNVSKKRLARYFTVTGDTYQISKSIINRVDFRYHDLLQDTYDTGFDLIICRNVNIYFTREAQDRVNKNFSRSLNRGGILFIGSSEMIFNYQQLGFKKISNGFYQKVG